MAMLQAQKNYGVDFGLLGGLGHDEARFHSHGYPIRF